MLGILEQEELLCELLSGENLDKGVTIRIGDEIKRLRYLTNGGRAHLLRGRQIALSATWPDRMDYAMISVVDFNTKSL